MPGHPRALEALANRELPPIVAGVGKDAPNPGAGTATGRPAANAAQAARWLQRGFQPGRRQPGVEGCAEARIPCRHFRGGLSGGARCPADSPVIETSPDWDEFSLRSERELR